MLEVFVFGIDDLYWQVNEPVKIWLKWYSAREPFLPHQPASVLWPGLELQPKQGFLLLSSGFWISWVGFLVVFCFKPLMYVVGPPAVTGKVWLERAGDHGTRITGWA